MEYYVLTVKLSTGANKYLVVRHDDSGVLVIYDKWDELTGALSQVEYKNSGK